MRLASDATGTAAAPTNLKAELHKVAAGQGRLFRPELHVNVAHACGQNHLRPAAHSYSPCGHRRSFFSAQSSYSAKDIKNRSHPGLAGAQCAARQMLPCASTPVALQRHKTAPHLACRALLSAGSAYLAVGWRQILVYLRHPRPRRPSQPPVSYQIPDPKDSTLNRKRGHYRSLFRNRPSLTLVPAKWGFATNEVRA